MIDAADRAGVRLYVAESMSYHLMARFLKNVVETGLYIGEVVSASVSSGFRARPIYAYPGRREWLSNPQQGGTGTWMLHGIHTMAMLRYVFGEVASVYMKEHHARNFRRDDVEGTMTGFLTMDVWCEANDDQREEVSYPGSVLSAFAEEIEDFADYVLEGIEGPTSGRSERKSLAIVQAGYESAKSGEVINLRERFGEL